MLIHASLFFMHLKGGAKKMPKSYTQIIRTDKTKSAVEDYIILGQWDKEPMSKEDREAWEELWIWFRDTASAS